MTRLIDSNITFLRLTKTEAEKSEFQLHLNGNSDSVLNHTYEEMLIVSIYSNSCRNILM